MITKQLIETIYSAAGIQRWNDHVRPIGFAELDKQAHKMIIAYVIAKFEENATGKKIDWQKLIEGGIFEFFHRVLLTDLKPAIFHELMDKKGRQLNDWVLNKLSGDIKSIDNSFKKNFESYLHDKKYAVKEKRILKAAHYLATEWEFRIIYNLNHMMHGIEKTKEEIEDQIEDYNDLAGVRNIRLDKKYYGFLDMCGQLGFQQRWAQIKMEPKISVLGHMLIVALFTYLLLFDKKLCKKRLYNNFYSALFHDLPEVLTRDIINPVKTSILGLDDIIKDYEQRQINEKMLPLLPKEWHDELRYFVFNEFKNRIIEKGGSKVIPSIGLGYNEDRFSPIDGEFVEACDKYAAFVEACLSTNYGIKSRHIDQAKKNVIGKFAKKKLLGVRFSKLFGYFRKT